MWHGITVDATDRLRRDLIERPTITMRFRFVLQPLMAAIARSELAPGDARTLSVRLLCNRRERFGRIILLGVVMDVIYQALVLKAFYPTMRSW